MTELSFTVEGLPAPQGSKRAFNHRHTGRVVMLESAGAKLKAWRDRVHAQAILAATTAHKEYGWKPPTAVHADLVFYLPRPKSHYRTGRYAGMLKDSAPRHHTTKPDGDKLTRAVFDSLTSSGVIQDDSRIVSYTTQKQYADDRPTGARITIKETT